MNILQENQLSTAALNTGLSKSKPFYLPAIDGLRFFAFLLVFFRHFTLTIYSPFFYNIGWSGVQLFFLISAFLLTRILKLEYDKTGHVSIKKYFIRRILRIWPLYFTYLLAITLLSLYLQTDSFSLTRFFGNVFFVDNILSAVNGYNFNMFSFHLWSISMEEQYYLILPFFIPWLLKQNKKSIALVFCIIFIVLVAAKAIAIFNYMQHPFIYVLPLSGESFVVGVLLGLGTFDTLFNKINGAGAFVAGVVLLIILNAIPSRNVIHINQILIYVICALAFGFLFLSAISNTANGFTYLLKNRFLVYLGKISFGLYIFHIPAIEITNYYFTKFNSGLSFLGFPSAFIITIITSIFSYELFEKKILIFKSKFAVIENKKG